MNALDWLAGPPPPALYRGTYATQAWPDLGPLIEQAVRTAFADQGLAIRVTRQPLWSLQAFRGWNAGFIIQLFPRSGHGSEAGTGQILVNRWSRWHAWGVQAVTAGVVLALVGGILGFAAAGWPIPGIGYVLLGLAFGVGLAGVRLWRPVLAAVERSAAARLSEEEIATLVGIARAAVEARPEPVRALP